MNIYLVRHGETDENIKGTYYGNIEAELTEKGIDQAKNAASFLKDISFKKVYCSEKVRAKKTLEIISHNEYVIDSRLNERNFGIFEGKTYKELIAERPEDIEAWNEDWKDYLIQGGESYSQFYMRIKSFMDELKSMDSTNCDDNILIVSHGGVLKSILVYVMGGDPDLYWKTALGNGDIIGIKYEYGNFFIDSIIPNKILEVYR